MKYADTYGRSTYSTRTVSNEFLVSFEKQNEIRSSKLFRGKYGWRNGNSGRWYISHLWKWIIWSPAESRPSVAILWPIFVRLLQKDIELATFSEWSYHGISCELSMNILAICLPPRLRSWRDENIMDNFAISYLVWSQTRLGMGLDRILGVCYFAENYFCCHFLIPKRETREDEEFKIHELAKKRVSATSKWRLEKSELREMRIKSWLGMQKRKIEVNKLSLYFWRMVLSYSEFFSFLMLSYFSISFSLWWSLWKHWVTSAFQLFFIIRRAKKVWNDLSIYSDKWFFWWLRAFS